MNNDIKLNRKKRSKFHYKLTNEILFKSILIFQNKIIAKKSNGNLNSDEIKEM